jgi:hypothetical protein
MKIGPIAALAALGIALSGCASIVEGTTQSVAVTSPPSDGAKCVLTSTEGVYYVTTPGNVIVHKTKNDLNVVCNEPGFKEAHVVVSPHFNGATAGNILAGGVIGIGIDAATGANYNYPDQIVVTLDSDGSKPMATLPGPATPPPTEGDTMRPSKPSS